MRNGPRDRTNMVPAVLQDDENGPRASTYFGMVELSVQVKRRYVLWT